jgi:repressor LexA
MTKKKTLTKQDVITTINGWIVEHGFPPTIEELRKTLKVGSKRTILRYLSWLEDEGDLERWSGARGLRLRASTNRGAETRAVPLVGEAPAGSLMIAEENREGWVQLPLQWLSPSSAKHFLLRVKGDSMNQAVVNDEHIEHGDLIVVEQRPTANSGEIIVALVNGQATIKRLAKGDGYWILKPESSNKAHSPIVLTEDFQIQGVVNRVLKNGAFNLSDDN